MWILILGGYHIFNIHMGQSPPPVPRSRYKGSRHTGFISQLAEVVPTSPTRAQLAGIGGTLNSPYTLSLTHCLDSGLHCSQPYVDYMFCSP